MMAGFDRSGLMRISTITGAVALTVGSIIAAGGGQPAHAETRQAQLEQLFPAATAFSPKGGDPPHINAYGDDGSGQQRLLGFTFVTTEMEPLERGHDGPIQMLVGMDTTGVLTGSIVVDHNEPFRYVSVDPPECAEQCKARSIRNAFKVGADVEAISRASMTVRRATRAVKHSARRVTRQLIVPPGAST